MLAVLRLCYLAVAKYLTIVRHRDRRGGSQVSRGYAVDACMTVLVVLPDDGL